MSQCRRRCEQGPRLVQLRRSAPDLPARDRPGIRPAPLEDLLVLQLACRLQEECRPVRPIAIIGDDDVQPALPVDLNAASWLAVQLPVNRPHT